jgi:uncharacterized repeat protein (TIGR01451 family)
MAAHAVMLSFRNPGLLLLWRLSMSHLGSNSLRIAFVIAILVLVPAWNPLLRSGISHANQPVANPTNVVSSTHSPNNPIAANRLASNYGKLPISFEVNQGQTDSSVQFLARGAGYTLFLTPGEAVLSLHSPHVNSAKPGSVLAPRTGQSSIAKSASTAPPSTVRLQLIGADMAAHAVGVDPLPGKSNYFIGNDPKKWHTDVPTFAKVRYSNVYPGIDLLYYGNQEGKLEHDFVVAPGADPNAIAINLRDAATPAPGKNGDLTVHTKSGDLTLESPTVYQDIRGQRKTIPATYLLANNQIKFQLGSYDRNMPLVIDPVLQYSGTFGGTTGEAGAAGIGVDGSGNTYIAGHLFSVADFPFVNPLERGVTGSFVSKINAAGTALVYSTFLGSDIGFTFAYGIAVDAAGRAYVVGTTDAGLPVKNAYQSTYAGDGDAFLTAFSPAGNSLIYSTYLGGNDPVYADYGFAIALDGSGNAYITGNSGHAFPTLHSVQIEGMVFVAKFGPTGVLKYSSVFAPFSPPTTSQQIVPTAIAVDASGAAYITGITQTSNFPLRKPAFQSTCLACPKPNGFVTKVSPAGDSLVYSTYLGASQGNYANAIKVDSSGNAYVAGVTGSGLPITSNAFQKTFGGSTDGFVTKLNASGTGLIASTYLGGNAADAIHDLAIDSHRQVYVTGFTTSSNFPLNASLQPQGNYLGEIFVTTLSGSLSSIAYYSTLFGSDLISISGPSSTLFIAVDKKLNVYLAGHPTSTGFPVTPGAIHTTTIDRSSIFASKLVIMDDLALGLSGSSASAAHGGNFTYTIAVTSKGPDFGYNVRIDDPLPAGTTLLSYNAGGGTCTAPAVGTAGTLHCSLPQLNKGATYTITLTVKVDAPSGTTLSNTATTLSNMQDFTTSNNKGTLTVKVL